MDHKKDFVQAELMVADYYQRRGWKLLRHQYRCVGSELDLIVIKQKRLAVVEVKQRAKWLGVSAEVAHLMGPRKYQALFRGLQHFLSNVEIDYVSCRIDLVVVKNVYSRKKRERLYETDNMIIYQDVRWSQS